MTKQRPGGRECHAASENAEDGHGSSQEAQAAGPKSRQIPHSYPVRFLLAAETNSGGRQGAGFGLARLWRL
jgi:hypothetical protein